MQRLTPSWCSEAPGTPSTWQNARAFTCPLTSCQRERRIEPLRAATTVAVGAARRALLGLAACGQLTGAFGGYRNARN
jgi:hypothetical protein